MPPDGPDPETRPRRRFRTRLGILAVGLIAFGTFGLRLADEPAFIDEWAYFSQAYFGPLWWGGGWDAIGWLEYPAIDLPPLPKYLIGAMLRLGDRPMPDRLDAFAWYSNTSTSFGAIDQLAWARWPMVALGAVGCMAAAAIGARAFGPGAGLLAGLLLAANPLYAMHARRAMSDVPTEAFLLLCLMVGMRAWSGLISGDRKVGAILTMGIGSGILAGLATLSKLSGGLALMTLGAWALLAVALPGLNGARKGLVVGSVALAGLVAFGTFLVGNPLLVANPSVPEGAPEGVIRLAELGVIGRTKAVMDHRAAVSKGAQEHPLFKEQGYPVSGVGSKLAVVGVQGFGRFGPLGPRRTDSIVRFDWRQDRGALLWGPLVLLGAIRAFVVGRRQWGRGDPPTGWAVLVQFLVAAVTVTAFIPMAWDRYYLPIQSGAALLASAAIAGGIGAFFGRFGTGTKGAEGG